MTSPPSEAPIADTVVEAALEAWADAGRQSEVPIQGNSMCPLLQPGDVVLVAHGREDLRLGDVLAYRSGDKVVIHRLLRRPRTGRLLTGGDNYPWLDSPISAELALGRVVAVRAQGQEVRLDAGPAKVLGWVLVASLWTRRYSPAWRVVSRFVHLWVRVLRP